MNATTSSAQNISSSYSNSTDLLKYGLSIEIKRKFPALGFGLICGIPTTYFLCAFLCFCWKTYRTKPSSYGTSQGDEENGGGESRNGGRGERAGRGSTRGLGEKDEVIGTFDAHVRDGYRKQEMVTIDAILVDKGPSKMEMSELRPFEG
ncbi:uncharacterized protein EAE97_009604 [Botrytis byssoidea]|uniref:Uncharacterized protein n=1 Tax=Botrytis byssoidea TaxID=139641 RepID=A0A9P5I8T6_9HELO|nr:uncharacterized protein EAE97_009604 [Botrytis byssoidea]KAF7930007.1 hypothetical protein EAE97_009604 [Botrytis byssoidea]